MTGIEHLVATNPKADPVQLADWVAALEERSLFVIPPGAPIDDGCVVLSEEDIVRLTNPVVWAPDGHTPVIIEFAGARLARCGS